MFINGENSLRMPVTVMKEGSGVIHLIKERPD